MYYYLANIALYKLFKQFLITLFVKTDPNKQLKDHGVNFSQ